MRSANNRSDSARRNQAAGVYNAGSLAAAEHRNGREGKLGRAPENPFDFTDSLVEQFGTPEMLLKDLKMAKRDIETLKN